MREVERRAAHECSGAPEMPQTRITGATPVRPPAVGRCREGGAPHLAVATHLIQRRRVAHGLRPYDVPVLSQEQCGLKAVPGWSEVD